MKKITILIFILTLFVLFSCRDKPSEPVVYNYYPATKLNSQRLLKVFVPSSEGKNILGVSIQGLFAQDEVTYYYNNGVYGNAWLLDLRDNYQIDYINVTLESMVSDYMGKYTDNGYILYDMHTNPESLNVATSICSVTGYLPVDISIEDFVINLGLSKKIDCREYNERYLFDNYKNELNNNGLMQISSKVVDMRDYAIANKYLCFYQDGTSILAMKLRTEIHEWAKTNSPIFGWGPLNEDSHVGISSRNGQFTIPSDWSFDLTVFTADELRIEEISQPNKAPAINASPDKHYVTIVRSDGDNIQTWENTFPFSKNDLNADRHISFPMNWSMSPSLIDLAPNILRYTYRKASPDDYFMASVSGTGYMYPSIFKNLGDYLDGLNSYLKRNDFHIVQILDSGVDLNVIEQYSKLDQVKGVLYCYGFKYQAGNGSIYFSENGKPFITTKESLWDIEPSDIASRVNKYPININSIEGYTIINLHPWSRTYRDVEELVSLFNSNIVVVDVDTFYDLVIKNVVKENKIF